jgi:hypothetical protein
LMKIPNLGFKRPIIPQWDERHNVCDLL